MQCACAMSSEACPALQYFFTLHHKRHDCWGGSMNMKCVLWFSLHFFPEIFLTLRRIQRDMIKNVYRVFTWSAPPPDPVIPVRFKRNLNFLDRFFEKKILASNFTNTRPFGAELFDADGRTDVTKLTAAIRNSASAPTAMTVLPKRVSSSAQLQGPQTFRTK